MMQILKRVGIGASCLLMSMAGNTGVATAAPTSGYAYVSLDDAKPPDSLGVDYFKVTNDHAAYGTSYVCDDVTCVPSIVVYRQGRTTVLQGGMFGNTANERGTVGGFVVTDPNTFATQAAVFDGKSLQLVPRLPDELSSQVLKVTDSGIVLVESDDASGHASFLLRQNGHTTPLDLGADQSFFVTVNESGVVAGTQSHIGPNNHYVSRAFRYDPRSGVLQTLEPLATEPDAWGVGVNSAGDVLGYSFIASGRERIGYWQGTEFRTSFVEGTPEFPTVSNWLRWNDAGLIVITDTTDGNSYIVPRPGVRLNLADLTTGLPAWTSIRAVNDSGDILGQGGASRYDYEHTFLLERTSAS